MQRQLIKGIVLRSSDAVAAARALQCKGCTNPTAKAAAVHIHCDQHDIKAGDDISSRVRCT